MSAVELVGLGVIGGRELAGALAGVGLAAALVGALAVVPTDRSAWSRGIAGALLALCGVGAFLFAYPGRWYGDGADLTLSVLAVYSLGVVTTASYLFANVADLTRRLGRAEALATAVPGTDARASEDTAGEMGEPSDAATAAAGERVGTNTDRSDEEVLYERTDDPEPTGTTAATNAETATNTTETAPERPPIDRIEPATEDFSWPDAGFSIEAIDGGPAANTPVDAWGSPATGSAGPDRADADSDRTGSNARDGDRSRAPIAVAQNGGGTVATSAVDSRSSAPSGTGSTDSTGAVPDRIDVMATGSERTIGARSSRSTTMGTETEMETADATGRTDTDRPIEGAPSADGGVDAIHVGPSVDRYCGNCAHFRYVQTERGLSPYCGYHDEVMDNMESCLEWTSNA